jgi:hypothetical protein
LPFLFLLRTKDGRDVKGGGEMAKSLVEQYEEQQPGKKAEKKPKTGTGSKAAEGTGEAPGQDVRANTDGNSGEEKMENVVKPNKNGAKKDGGKEKKARKALRKAMKNAVREKSAQIATALVNEVINGDKRSADMMISFIEKKKKDGGTSSRHGGLTAADLLGSEEEWEGESYEAMEGQTEVSMGGREPEGRIRGNGDQ